MPFHQHAAIHIAFTPMKAILLKQKKQMFEFSTKIPNHNDYLV